MSANPFNRNTVREPRLGAIISDDPGTHDRRDAVHNAVVPLKATCALKPGQRIGITADEEHADPNATALGIVDPFLTTDVQPGQRFWLFIFPGQVTTLRHEWTHPAFIKDSKPMESELERKAKSEKWLRDWCNANDCPRYETVLAAVLDGQRSDWDNSYIHFNGQDAHADIPDEFWDHMEIVTGKKYVGDERATAFSCSC